MQHQNAHVGSFRYFMPLMKTMRDLMVGIRYILIILYTMSLFEPKKYFIVLYIVDKDEQPSLEIKRRISRAIVLRCKTYTTERNRFKMSFSCATYKLRFFPRQIEWKVGPEHDN